MAANRGHRSMRGMCCAVLAAALLLRGGMWYMAHPRAVEPLEAALSVANAVETAPSAATEAADAAQDYPCMVYTPPQRRSGVLFRAEDAAELAVRDRAEVGPDTAALLTAPLELDRNADGPLVLVMHTHATEAYCDSPDYHSSDPAHSVIQVGQTLCDRLNANGIRAIHDTTVYDAEGYIDAYEHSAEGISALLAQYPSIQIVIDVHRDAVEDADGNQLALTGQLNGEDVAELLLVMGTDVSGLYHPNWQENVSFALKLQLLGQRESDGVFRPLLLRASRYNQHLTPHSILLEVGAAGNTLEQAEASAVFFADCLKELLDSV